MDTVLCGNFLPFSSSVEGAVGADFVTASELMMGTATTDDSDDPANCLGEDNIDNYVIIVIYM